MSRQTDELRLCDRGNPFGMLALSVAALVIGLALTASQFAGAGQQADAPPEKTVYQDFRNKRPLLPVFTLLGPDKEGEIKAEDEGLRITLSATRPQNWPTEVTTTFPLSGDFEITGTYEFLAGERPAKGYGVGVHLNIADTENRIKFAKICRAIMPGQGSVHLAQYWHTKKDHQMHSKPTEAKAGQLRLVRVDGALRFLVSDGPGEKFREIWFQGDFGNDDMEHFVSASATAASRATPWTPA